MQENLKKILFVLLLIFLSFPLFQRITGLFKESELQVSFIKAQNDTSISKINFLKEEMEKNGTHFFTVFAPSKESIYPEKLPARYIGATKEHSDYEDFIEGFKKYNIPFIDFNSYFKQLRSTC